MDGIFTYSGDLEINEWDYHSANLTVIFHIEMNFDVENCRSTHSRIIKHESYSTVTKKCTLLALRRSDIKCTASFRVLDKRIDHFDKNEGTIEWELIMIINCMRTETDFLA